MKHNPTAAEKVDLLEWPLHLPWENDA